MRITGNAQQYPRLDSKRGSNDSLALQTGQIEATRPVHDLLDISPEGRQLAAGAVETREAQRIGSLPGKPNGAPDDYVPMEELMERFDLESYAKFREAMTDNAVDGLALLLKFARQVPRHPEWVPTYWKEKQTQ